MVCNVLSVFVVVFCLNQITNAKITTYEVDCSTLRLGQFICPHPEYDYIDAKTQQPRGCTRENKAKVLCKAADGIICTETNNSTFIRDIPCKWTNGYSFETAMLLSIFLGMFGADRFYLGYPAIGLLKFCTLGFMFLGQLIDIILIATQVVGPADGSYYVIPYFGARMEMIRSDNWTYRLPLDDCFQYDTKSTDCHKRNIECFSSFCSSCGLDTEGDIYSAVVGLLETTDTSSTEEHKISGLFGSGDQHYFLDLDMVVLGSDPEQYAEYSSKIQQEYSFLSPMLYKNLRVKVLQNFLQIPNIFATKEFREKYEEQARSNILHEVEQLK